MKESRRSAWAAVCLATFSVPARMRSLRRLAFGLSLIVAFTALLYSFQSDPSALGSSGKRSGFWHLGHTKRTPPSKARGHILLQSASNTSNAAQPTVATDKSDYAPGTIVTITGAGWTPGETVTLSLVESPYYDTHPNLTATVAADGT